MSIHDLRLRIAFSAVNPTLRATTVLAHDFSEDEIIEAKRWLTENETTLDALIGAAKDFVRTQYTRNMDVAAIAFLDDISVVCPYLQVLLRFIPLLYDFVLEKIDGRQDMQLLANMRALAAM